MTEKQTRKICFALGKTNFQLHAFNDTKIKSGTTGLNLRMESV